MDETLLHANDEIGQLKGIKILIKQSIDAQNEFLKMQERYIKALFWVTFFMTAATVAIAIATVILSMK